MTSPGIRRRLSLCLLLAVLALSAGAPAGCQSPADDSPEKSAAPSTSTGDGESAQPGAGANSRHATQVEVLRLTPRDFQVFTTYIGHLLPAERIVVRSELEGVVENAPFEEGQRLRKGAVLAEISTRQLVLRRDLARSNHALALATHARNRDLAKKKLVPPSQLDVSRNERDVAKLNLELAELELSKSLVRAPISGTVKTKSVAVGAYVKKGEALAEILDLSHLLALVHVPEKEIRHLVRGEKVSLVLDALPGREFTGRIATIGVEADQANRSFPVEVALPNPGYELRPGMLARVRVATGSYRDQLLVPRHAVLERERGRVVYIAKDGKALERDVDVGIGRDGEVQIISGLKQGERLIVTGQHQVTANEPVHILRETEQAPATSQ